MEAAVQAALWQMEESLARPSVGLEVRCKGTFRRRPGTATRSLGVPCVTWTPDSTSGHHKRHTQLGRTSTELTIGVEQTWNLLWVLHSSRSFVCCLFAFVCLGSVGFAVAVGSEAQSSDNAAVPNVNAFLVHKASRAIKGIVPHQDLQYTLQ